MRDSMMILLVSTNQLGIVKQTHVPTQRRVFND
jgi:hypothetical protein